MAILKRKDKAADNGANPADAAAAAAAAKVNETLAAAAAKPVEGTATTVTPQETAGEPDNATPPVTPKEETPKKQEETPKKQEAAPPVVATPAAVPGPVLGKKGFVYDSFQALIPPMDFGALPRIKASGGFIMDGDNRTLGSWIKTQLLSWNNRWCISPNQDGAPPDLAKFSADNETVDNDPSLTVAAHLAELKNLGYPKAESKRYVEVVCLLLDAEKDTEYIGELVQLQLSPTMHPAFLTSLNVQTTFKIAQGLLTEEEAKLLSWHTEPATSKKVNKSWTKLVPTLSVFDKK